MKFHKYIAYTTRKIVYKLHVSIYKKENAIKVMCNPNFNIFLNQDSNVYLEKDGCQALRTRKHYMQIFFWMILLVFS